MDTDALQFPESNGLVCAVCRRPTAAVGIAGRPVCSARSCLSEHSRWQSRGNLCCRQCGVFLRSPQERLMQRCDRADCRRTNLVKLQVMTTEQHFADLRLQAASMLAEISTDENQQNPATGAPVFVPFLDRVISPLSVERLDEFRMALEGIVRASFKNSTDPPIERPVEDHGEVLEPEIARQAGRARGTCRGWCCRNARHTAAYIDVATIQRYRCAHPEAIMDEILAHYVSFIASKPYTESCVYHGEKGCALPGTMRSLVCDRYLCEGLMNLVVRLRSEDPGISCIAATQGDHVVCVASASSDAAGTRSVV